MYSHVWNNAVLCHLIAWIPECTRGSIRGIDKPSKLPIGPELKVEPGIECRVLQAREREWWRIREARQQQRPVLASKRETDHDGELLIWIIDTFQLPSQDLRPCSTVIVSEDHTAIQIAENWLVAYVCEEADGWLAVAVARWQADHVEFSKLLELHSIAREADNMREYKSRFRETSTYDVFFYAFGNALNYIFDDGFEVSVRFVVSESHHSPMRVDSVPVYLNDSVIDLFACRLEPVDLSISMRKQWSWDETPHFSHSSSSTNISS